MNWKEYSNLSESVSHAMAKQVTHAHKVLDHPVSSLAADYAIEWAGDEALKRMKKHPKLFKAYKKYAQPKKPKKRLAVCCKVEVVKGAGGFFLLCFCSIAAIMYSLFSSSPLIF